MAKGTLFSTGRHSGLAKARARANEKKGAEIFLGVPTAEKSQRASPSFNKTTQKMKFFATVLALAAAVSAVDVADAAASASASVAAPTTALYSGVASTAAFGAAAVVAVAML
ncbi:hypothetical protein HDU79_009349 [Rhizoclosmatium sp. JEL0117]|nr:hypothetical protein HDU79_009349 [Rhizoclosmatium sp. JEL0117]